MSDITSQIIGNFRPTQLEYPSQYDLREMVLDLAGGSQSYDIRALVVEWNWYEDMLGTCISGNVVLYDTLNILGNASLSGNETLLISVDTPTKDNPLKMDFTVYAVGPIQTNPEENTKRAQIYTLHFCSKEKITDSLTLVQKSYKGTLISTMINDILGPQYLNTLKPVNIEPTVGPQDIIVPAFRPLRAIDWLTTRAVSATQSPSFVFFENRYGYYFSSLENLIKNVPANVPRYILSPKGFDNSDVPDKAIRMQTIKDYEFIGTPDSLKQIQQGAFGSVLMTYDPVRMKYTEVPYNILDGYKKMGIGTPPYVPSSGLNQYPNAKRYYAPTNYNRSQTEYGANHDELSHNSLVESFAGRRESLLAANETFKIRMVLNGDVSLTAGTMIDVAYPSLDRRSAADANKLDDVYSGNYMITALRHRFTATAHTTVVEVVKGTPTKGMARY